MEGGVVVELFDLAVDADIVPFVTGDPVNLLKTISITFSWPYIHPDHDQANPETG